MNYVRLHRIARKQQIARIGDVLVVSLLAVGLGITLTAFTTLV